MPFIPCSRRDLFGELTLEPSRPTQIPLGLRVALGGGGGPLSAVGLVSCQEDPSSLFLESREMDEDGEVS